MNAETGALMSGEPRLALFDMHCHLDFAPNARELLAAASRLGIGAFANTVTPQGFVRFTGCAAADAHPQASNSPVPGGACARIGVGLHPWWVADGRCGDAELALFEELAQATRFIGEVGLDFAPRRAGTYETQLAAFDRVCAACARGGKVFSIHAVRSATTVLDVLERHRCTEHSVCILHWFSGTSDELVRAARLGCHISVGTRMLATKRGRAYVRAFPAERIVLETDLPSDDGDVLDPAAWAVDLGRALCLLNEAVGCDLAGTVAATSRSILNG